MIKVRTMSQNSSDDLRNTAELLINQTRLMQSRSGGNPSNFDMCKFLLRNIKFIIKTIDYLLISY